MTEERKQELRQLLNEAMESLEIQTLSGKRYSFPVDVYIERLRERWASYSAESMDILGLQLGIISQATKSKLLNFLKAELAPFIDEDRIQSASSCIAASLGLSNGFSLDKLLAQFLNIAAVRGIEDAVSAFDKCTEETSSSFQAMALLEGIKLKTKIQIFEGMQLIPLPRSTSKLPRHLLDLSSSFGLPKDFCCSKTLLVIDCSISPIFCKPFGLIPVKELLTQEHPRFQVEVNGENFPNFRVNDFYEKFCQALSFACNSPVQISLRWKFLPEDELFNLNIGGFSGVGYVYRSFQELFPTVGEAEIDEAKCLYRSLDKLDSGDRKKLRIPIDRWMKSKTSGDPDDKIIDLGIAFEALYLSEIKEKTELSFRLRLHAAWHLGKDKEHRKSLMTEFREIYDWRSAVVHTGKLPTKTKRTPFSPEEIEKFIKRVQDLCQKSIIKIMEDGQYPDWNDLILGSEVESDVVALGENPGGLG